MSRPILEVIALGVDDAIAAEAGGADRLELVTDMAADGLTPTLDGFTAIRSAVDLPLRVMLRATDGFTAGGASDVAALCASARELRAAGADQFVFGFLNDAGQPDLATVRALADAIEGAPWTFHRAIDRAADRDLARKRLVGLPGLDTYLTAGAAQGVDAGLDALVAEAARGANGEPGYEPTILVGGGLRLDHLPALRAAGVNAFHIGGAARPRGWTGPVAAEAVAAWRAALDTPVAVG
ncbi:copper homeostasis protein CutC [Streptomyces sp. NPDC057702]|uniref:copper homeostasis protein CutC n=1 Tax=unclassified Streptomyces TaxID=2593676 RepID=UPI0036A70AAA